MPEADTEQQQREIGWVEKLICEHDKRHAERINALEKAIVVARESMEKRLEQMNEWRAQLSENERSYLPRTEFQAHHAKLEGDLQKAIDSFNDDIRSLRESRATLEGKASQSSVNLAMIIAIIGIAISGLTLIFHVLKIF